MPNHQSKIEKLIAKLCPNGVEYKELGEVCKFQRGTSITQKDVTDGDVPVIAGGQKPSYYHNKPNRIGETIAVSGSGAYAGFVSYWTIPVFLSDSFSVNPNVKLNSKYVFYFLKHNQEKIHKTKKGSGVPHVHGSSIAKFLIPIPPLAVQQEIVKILDTFTTLEAELEAELEERKKQYEHYREELLTFGEDVEWKTLGEVCNVASGGTPAKAKAEFWEDGNIPWLKSESCNNEPVYHAMNFITDLGLKNSSAKLLEKNTTLMALVGATIFKTAFLEFDSTINQNIASMKSKDKSILNDKFIFFYLTNLYSELKSSMKSYGMLNLTTLRKIPIPIPPLSEQERIVAILDKFDALVNDISVGLPAEINARRKQYEYYRDKLLTFKQFSSSGNKSNSPPLEGCQPKDDGVVL